MDLSILTAIAVSFWSSHQFGVAATLAVIGLLVSYYVIRPVGKRVLRLGMDGTVTRRELMDLDLKISEKTSAQYDWLKELHSVTEHYMLDQVAIESKRIGNWSTDLLAVKELQDRQGKAINALSGKVTQLGVVVDLLVKAASENVSSETSPGLPRVVDCFVCTRLCVDDGSEICEHCREIIKQKTGRFLTPKSKQPVELKPVCVKCDQPSSVHLTEVVGGVARDTHWCEDHALKETGVDTERAYLRELDKAAASGATYICPVCLNRRFKGFSRLQDLSCSACYAHDLEYRGFSKQHTSDFIGISVAIAEEFVNEVSRSIACASSIEAKTRDRIPKMLAEKDEKIELPNQGLLSLPADIKIASQGIFDAVWQGLAAGASFTDQDTSNEWIPFHEWTCQTCESKWAVKPSCEPSCTICSATSLTANT